MKCYEGYTILILIVVVVAKALKASKTGVADGARTRDHWNHNPGLYQLSYSHHGRKYRTIYPGHHLIYGAPGRIRTCDPRLRRPLLYPTELRAHAVFSKPKKMVISPKWSEWRDSNPRHPAPKAGALPGCATLRQNFRRPHNTMALLHVND